MTSTILFAIALVLGQDATARIENDPKPFWSGEEGWRVFAYPEEEMCDIGFETASGEYVTVGYKPKDHQTSLMVTNKHATSLKAGQVKRLAVAFGTAPGVRFGAVHMLSFEVLDADGKLVLSATDTYPDFLDDFGKSGVMGVLNPGGGVVTAISLVGSSQAITQLRSCAVEAAGLDPKDPFLPQR